MRSSPVLAGLVLLLTGTTVAPAAAGEASGGREAAACGPVAISHRGIGAGARESTLPAFRGVLRLGVRVLEADVRFTRDQVPVIMHDATVDRTTDGHGRVDEMTYREISRLDAGGGAEVPRLGWLVALADRRGAALLLEMKPSGATRSQVRTVLRAVRARDLGRRTTIQSFHAANVRRVHRMAPRIRTGLVLSPRDRVPAPVPRFVDVLVPHRDLVTRTRVRRWHRASVRVYAWIGRRRAQWRRLDRAGVDAVILDRPAAYLRWVQRGCH